MNEPIDERRGEVLFGTPPMPTQDRLRAQLSAVELLLARTDRDVAHHDILIATALELLSDGALTTSQLMTKVCEAWPGLRLLTRELESALEAAATVHNIHRAVGFGGLETWELLPTGRMELEESAAKGGEILGRFRSQIADELRRRTGECRLDDLNPLCELVIGAVRAAIGRFFELREVTDIEKVGGWLRVRGAEVVDVERWIRDRVAEPERASHVLAIALTALDQSTSVGSEMVHHLVTGHLLYLFMSRPDEIMAASTAGPLSGEILFIDTPILFRLADEPKLRLPLLELLAAARRSGMRLLASNRTFAEFERHLDSLASHEVRAVDRALRRGANPAVLAGLQREVKLLNIWLRWASGRNADSRDWIEFRSHLDGIEGPANLLKSIGVETEDDGRIAMPEDRSNIEPLRSGLLARTSLNGVRGRGDSAIDHDALMLNSIYLSRRDNPAGPAKVWPGAFCLTTDRQLDDVYNQVFGEQVFPVALTVSQLAQIVSVYSDARVSEALALKVAGGLLDTELISRTAAIPVELAQLMAMAVAEDSPTDIEVEQLELDLRRAFDDSRERLETGTTHHDDLVRQIAESRRARKAAARAQADRAADEEGRRVELEITRRDEQIQAAKRNEERLLAVVSERESELTATQRANAADRAAWAAERLEQRRKHGVDLATLVAVIIGAGFLATGHAPAAIVVIVAAVFMWIYGREWASGKASTGLVIASVVTAAATIVPLVMSAVRSDASDPPKAPSTPVVVDPAAGP